MQHTAGVHAVDRGLYLARYAGSDGDYRLGGTGQLTAYSAYVGYDGNATFVQTSGSAEIGGWLYAGYNTAARGRLAVSGGQYQGADSTLYLGYYGAGELAHSGGSVAVYSAYLGYNHGADGNYVMTGGELITDGSVYVGRHGRGRFSLTGGQAQIDGTLRLGYSSAGEGTLHLGGNAVLAVTGFIGHLNVGEAGRGTFEQSGGSCAVDGTVSLGAGAGAEGTYLLAGGDFQAWGFYVGSDGRGEVIQTGGSARAQTLTLGVYGAGEGTWRLSGGSLEVGSLNLGRLGRGAMAIADAAADVTVWQKLAIGSGGQFQAVPGSRIHMTGSAFENTSTDPAAVADLANLTLIFEGGPEELDPFEVAGIDRGTVAEGFANNFALGTLQIGGADVGHVKLVDLFDNQPGWTGREVLYVKELIIGSGSTLNLNGMTIYCTRFTGETDSITAGGGQLIVLPEPGTLALLGLGAAAVIVRRRRRA